MLIATSQSAIRARSATLAVCSADSHACSYTPTGSRSPPQPSRSTSTPATRGGCSSFSWWILGGPGRSLMGPKHDNGGRCAARNSRLVALAPDVRGRSHRRRVCHRLLRQAPQGDLIPGRSPADGSGRRRKPGEYLVHVGEAPLALLREEHLAVHDHVELTLLARNHLGGEPGAVQLGHETRGPFVIAASDRAVKDAHVRHSADCIPAVRLSVYRQVRRPVGGIGA